MAKIQFIKKETKKKVRFLPSERGKGLIWCLWESKFTQALQRKKFSNICQEMQKWLDLLT